MDSVRPRAFSKGQTGFQADTDASELFKVGTNVEYPSAALLRLMRRRVPPEKRQRTEMSCDWCKKKRCKCVRKSTTETCRACSDIGRQCMTTEPRKRRVYRSLSVSTATGGPMPVAPGRQQLKQQKQQKQHKQHKQHKQKNPPAAQEDFPPPTSPTATSPSLGSIKVHSPGTISVLQPAVQFSHPFEQSPPPPSHRSSLLIDPIDPCSTSMPMTSTDPRLLLRVKPSDPICTVAPLDIVVSATSLSSVIPAKMARDHPTAQQRLPGGELATDDAHGSAHYTGPLSSYAMLSTLRGVMDSHSQSQPVFRRKMRTFDAQGTNAGHQNEISHGDGAVANMPLPPRDVADALVTLFFDRIECDFPIFHRAYFHARYESMWTGLHHTVNADAAWLMCLSMVFVLGLEAASPIQIRAIRRRLSDQGNGSASSGRMDLNGLHSRYVVKAKEVLPDIISGSTLLHVQALMLYCRFLHLTCGRNACWNLTGAAIRIAISIGLHRDVVRGKQDPVERDLRRQVWWTLYSFERMECSSLGRTSAIDDAECTVGLPLEGVLDLGDSQPVGFVNAQTELTALLGAICKLKFSASDNFDGDTTQSRHGDSEGSASISKDQIACTTATAAALEEWYTQLPSSLWLQPKLPSPHRRPVLLLHIQFHYTMTLLFRPFLVAAVMQKLSILDGTVKSDPSMISSAGSSPPVLSSETHASASNKDVQIAFYARKCVDSAKETVAVLGQLVESGLFNSKTWWDVHFVESACMPLALSYFAKEGDACNDGGIFEALKMCNDILRKCREFSPTTQQLAAATVDFTEPLLSSLMQMQKVKQEEQSQQPIAVEALQMVQMPFQHGRYEGPQQMLPQKQQHVQQDDLFSLQGMQGPGGQPFQVAPAHVIHKVDGLGDMGSSASASSVSGGGSVGSISSSAGSQSSSHSSDSPGDSYEAYDSSMPVLFGSMDAFNQPVPTSSMSDPFPMPWNMLDMPQVWSGGAEWTEPETYW